MIIILLDKIPGGADFLADCTFQSLVHASSSSTTSNSNSNSNNNVSNPTPSKG